MASKEAILTVGNSDDEYSIRLIEEEDLPLLLQWRNSPRIHSMMFTDHIITEAEHRAWFERISKLDPALNVIVCYNTDPIGYIGFSDVDWENGTCVPGFYIGDTEKASVLAGMAMIFFVNDYVCFKLKMCKVYNYVLASNKRLLRMYKCFHNKQKDYLKDYVLKGGTYHDVIVFEGNLQGWAKSRDNFKKNFM